MHEDNSNESKKLKATDSSVEWKFPSLLCKELLEFFKFCSKKSLKLNIIDSTKEYNEIVFIETLQRIRKGINFQNKKIVQLENNVTNSSAELSDNEMMNRIHNLQVELLISQKSKNDVKVLKTKLMLLVEKLRNEKDLRVRSDDEILLLKKKNCILTDHTEKLLNYLKREASDKLKILDSLKKSEKTNKKILNTILLMDKKNSIKDRLILELQESKKYLIFILFRLNQYI